MITRRPRPFVTLVLIAGVVISGAGCRDKKPDVDPTPAPPTVPGLVGYPGQNADATKAYLASLDFSATDSIFEGYLSCDEPARCEGADSVRMRIVPELRAHQVPIRAALDSMSGYIVASITNLDARPFGLLGIQGNETAYLWVGPMQSGGNRIAVFSIDTGGVATLRSIATEAGYCPGATARRTIPAVHVNEMPACADSSLYSAAAQTASRVTLAATATSSITAAAAASAFSGIRGLWFACSLGCCEPRGFQVQN